MEWILSLFYPRRCPLCDAVLGPDALDGVFCRDCAGEAARLSHNPPRLPGTEHSFYALAGAASPLYYTDVVRRAVLRCKLYGRPWYAREFADLIAVRIFGAQPAVPGRRPVFHNETGLPLYHLIVPVPPRHRTLAPRMPRAMARRLGVVLHLPVQEALTITRTLKEQKTLDLAQRLQNTRGAYAVRPGTDLTGKRVLLVDDLITSGATASACAQALLAAGAAEVFAVSAAVTEDLPRAKEKQRP